MPIAVLDCGHPHSVDRQQGGGATGVLPRTALLGYVAAFLVMACANAAAFAQQTTISTPFQGTNTSFFEQIGTQWGVKGPNFFFQFGGPGMGQPVFGNPDPGAGIRGGWAWNSGPWSGHFNFIAAQGSRSSLVSQTPSITLPNGGTGYFSDTSQSPFVISYIPVVGGAPQLPYGYPMVPPPGFGFPYQGVGPVYSEQGNPRVQAMLRARAEGEQPPDPAPPPAPAPPRGPAPELAEPERAPVAAAPERASTAAAAAPSVAEARLMHQQEQAAANREAAQLLERGITAEEAGKPGVARVYYQMAAQRAEGDLREQAEARLNGLTPQ
ncbi:MAG: hypothetical protein RBS80_28730 [Thermoguttaceae bacterium]|jgi:hypothetical protein|nr:hypothetical protein [Thermoguttaceae bacterium]